MSRTMLVFLTLAAACAAAPPTAVVAPDGARDGAHGADGPQGAAWTRFDQAVRATDGRAVDVIFPAFADGTPDLSDAPYPVVVLSHGGFVDRARYHWLGQHLATRGYVTVLPAYDLLLPITEIGNGPAALDATIGRATGGDPVLSGLIDTTSPVAAMGHSLGGVVAASQWLDEPAWRSLVLLAAAATPGEEGADTQDRPTVALVGSVDEKYPPDTMGDALRRLDGPLWFGVVEGMNHYGWTDDARPGELKKDGVPTRPAPSARADALAVIDAFLDATLRGDGDWPAATGFAGVTERAP